MVFLFAKVFDIRNLLLNDVIKNMELLYNSGIDFLLTKMFKEDKTSGWLATDYIKFIKLIL